MSAADLPACRFRPGDRVQHFKRALLTPAELEAEPELYRYDIVGVAEQTETGETLMIYRPRYGERRLFARPLAMFLSEVDREKYPDVTQRYRFEPY
jgi:hypothetical protein